MSDKTIVKSIAAVTYKPGADQLSALSRALQGLEARKIATRDAQAAKDLLKITTMDWGTDVLVSRSTLLKGELASIDKRITKLNENNAALDLVLKGAIEVEAWLKQVEHPKLETTDVSRVHRLIEKAHAGMVMDMEAATVSGPQDQLVLVHEHVFVIQHDWEALLAEKVSHDEWKPPFEECVFEMRVSGRNVVAHVAAPEGKRPRVGFFLEAKDQSCWIFYDALNTRSAVIETCLKQVQAACIMLDAEVVTHEVQRQPHKLNQKRAQAGKQPLLDFHVLKLNRRSVAKPLEDHQSTGRRKRLHFRRGHYRHLENHKVWIRWTMVGSPDLGFVDKEYRL
jgi:hypothetical protein